MVLDRVPLCHCKWRHHAFPDTSALLAELLQGAGPTRTDVVLRGEGPLVTKDPESAIPAWCRSVGNQEETADASGGRWSDGSCGDKSCKGIEKILEKEKRNWERNIFKLKHVILKSFNHMHHIVSTFGCLLIIY